MAEPNSRNQLWKYPPYKPWTEPADDLNPIFDADGKIGSDYLPPGAISSTLFAITSAQDATGTIDGSTVLTVDGGTGGVGIGMDGTALGGGAKVSHFGVANNADQDHEIKLRAGATGDYRNYFNWQDWEGNQQWLMGRNASNVFILYDTVGAAHRFWFEDTDGSDHSYISAAGTGAVIVNGIADNASGTGGLIVQNGGATKLDIARFVPGVAARIAVGIDIVAAAGDTSPFTQFSTNAATIGGSSGSAHTIFRNNGTATTNQTIRIVSRGYTSATHYAAMLFAVNSASANVLNIGGGSGAMNASTQISFYTGVGITAGSGTELVRMISDRVTIGAGQTADAKLHVIQGSASGAIACLHLEQLDTDEPFAAFEGTSAASATSSISSLTAGNTIQGFVRVAINGTDYWMPYYDAPTS